MKLRPQPFPSPRLGTDHRKATRAEMQQLREGRAGLAKQLKRGSQKACDAAGL